MYVARIDRLHRRQQRIRVALHVGEERVGVVERQMPDLELERAVARHDVERGSAADHADVRRRERDVVRGILALRASRNARARSAIHATMIARDLHGVDALRRQRRMRLVSAHAAAPGLLALVRDDELHAGRLADDAAGRRNAARDDV